MKLLKKFKDWVGTDDNKPNPIQTPVQEPHNEEFDIKEILGEVIKLNDDPDIKGKIQNFYYEKGISINSEFKIPDNNSRYSNISSDQTGNIGRAGIHGRVATWKIIKYNNSFKIIAHNESSRKLLFDDDQWDKEYHKSEILPIIKLMLLRGYNKILERCQKEKKEYEENLRRQKELEKNFLKKYNTEFFQAQFSNVSDLCTDFKMGNVSIPIVYGEDKDKDQTRVVKITIEDKDILSDSGAQLNKKSIEIMEELFSVSERLEDDGFKTHIFIGDNCIHIIIKMGAIS